MWHYIVRHLQQYDDVRRWDFYRGLSVKQWNKYATFSFLEIFLRFYLFIHRDTEREREREAETQAEGEAGSREGAWRGTQSRVSRITPLVADGAKPLHHQGCPPTPKYSSKINENISPHINLYMNVYSTFLHNSQKLETTQIPISIWTFSCTLFIQCNIFKRNELLISAKRMNINNVILIRKEFTLHDFIYMRY